ncbi:GIY-YIG nuclease family protein [Sorangium sp. So ce363]|uniref:GIY-YIG nuclease family protein n=1 Tax=Sorangium sp. So ce363 TaxID=3133304 RepID=UPI003F63CE70
MRTAEVGNWTGLALVCPRTDLARLALRPEVRKTGIYILVGPSETATSGMSVYVGEGDEVWSRLTSHDSNKDFWTHVVMFVSKDENLTKAHVRWLEAALVREIRKAKRAEVYNGNEPTGGKLPEADTADMETYFDNVRLLLPTLGVSVFTADVAPKPDPTGDTNEIVLELRWEDARAECVVRDGQFVIRQGSSARVREVESLGDGARALRKNLRDAGVLVPANGNPNLFRFTQEYAFDSPSGAASVVSGTGLNGRVAWKVKNEGISYKEWQEKLVASEASDAS